MYIQVLKQREYNLSSLCQTEITSFHATQLHPFLANMCIVWLNWLVHTVIHRMYSTFIANGLPHVGGEPKQRITTNSSPSHYVQFVCSAHLSGLQFLICSSWSCHVSYHSYLQATGQAPAFPNRSFTKDKLVLWEASKVHWNFVEFVLLSSETKCCAIQSKTVPSVCILQII